MLLSQVHRLRALDLLGRFLDLGPWAVSLVSYSFASFQNSVCGQRDAKYSTFVFPFLGFVCWDFPLCS